MIGSPFNVKAQIRVDRLVLQDTGTYDSMFRRPFNVSINDHSLVDKIGRRLESSNLQTGTINSALFAGIGNQILCPSPNVVGNVYIPNGWDCRRFRFVMEVSLVNIDSHVRYIIQGFTEHGDVSLSGQIDPSMKFIANSYVKLNRVTTVQNGNMTYSDIVSESSQIIDGRIVNNITSGAGLARPYDMFNIMSNGHMTNHHTGELLLTDHRNELSDGRPVTSRRRNNNSGNYLSTIAGNYLVSSALADFGQDNNNIFSRSADSTYETAVADLDFFSTIKRLRGFSVEPTTTFSFNELMGMDPSIDDRTQILKTRAMQRHQQFSTDGQESPFGFNQSSVGQTDGWNGCGMETVIATIMGTNVPAFMFESMLEFVWFEVSNKHAGGQFLFLPKNVRSMTGADISGHLQSFMGRIIQELMRDLSRDGDMILDVECCCDVYGDFWLNISIDGRPGQHFIAPVFADGLFTPVITPSSHVSIAMGQQLETLCNIVKDVSGSGLNPNTISHSSMFI